MKRSDLTTRRRRWAVLGLSAVALALTACSSGSEAPADAGGGSATAPAEEVVLATHDSWSVPDEVVKAFEKESGYRLKVVSVGDAGELTNRLVLTKDRPIADAVYGIDNTFATRAVDAGVLEDYTSAASPASAEAYALDGAAGRALTPVDWGDVCVNVDDTWFAKQDVAPPRTLDDLVTAAYRDLFVTPGAATSSPGFAFLLATIGTYGEDGWQDYWRELVDNGVRITSGWSDAYEVDFTAGGGGGDRPIVLSYNSSPPFTIPEGGGRPTTSALLDTCFRQVEYAGVLANASNPDGARALVDFMSSRTFQEALPENMYVFPVDSGAKIPALWAKWAAPAEDPITVDPAKIDQHRDEWIREWSDITSG